MTSVFGALCSALGLSLREAADFLNVRDDTARGWAIGRRPTPQPVLGELVRLQRQMEHDATRLIESHRRKAERRGDTCIEVSISSTTTGASEITGMREALYGRVVSALMADGYTVSSLQVRGSSEGGVE